MTTSNDQNRLFAIIGYIIPILFFVPLLSDAKKDPYAKFHANQQLNLLLYWIALNIIVMIPILGWLVYMVGVLFGFVLIVMGVMNASSSSQKPLPLIGKFALIK
jgi:uncharacterized membrane protein